MAIAALPAVVAGSIAAFVSVVHLTIWLRGAGPRHHLTFALTCLVVAAYDICCAALYSADTVAAGAVWQRRQSLALMLGGITLVWFLHDYAGAGGRRAPRALSALYALFVLLWFVAPPAWLWTDLPDIKTVTVPLLGTVTYREVVAGPLFRWFISSLVFTAAYVLMLGRRLLAEGRRAHGWRLLAGMGIFFLGIANDAAVALGFHASFYLIELAFLGLVLMMSYALSEGVISARRLTASLQASRQSYREVLDAVQDAVFVYDAMTGRVLDVNEATVNLFGVTRAEACASGLADLSAYPAELARARAREHVTRALTEGPQVFEWRARKKSGAPFWIEVALRAAQIGGVPRVIAVAREIEDRKTAEEALRRSEENLTITLNSIGDGVLATDDAGMVVRMNPVAEQLTGWTLAEAGGRPVSEVLRLLHSATGDPLTDPASLILAAQDGAPREDEAILAPREGRRRLVTVSGSPIRERSGGVAGVVLVLRDVTDQHALQDQLRQAQKMDAVGRLAGGVAHDFNNLLQAIEGYRNLAATALDDPAELRECLDDIGRAIERAATLTRQLLAFSRQDSAAVRAVDLDGVLAGMTRMLGPLLGADIELRLELEGGPTDINGAPDHIEQILLNLALNARDAMPTGGRLTVKTRSLPAGSAELPLDLRQRPESFVALSVADTGRGISPEIQDRIFEPFFTTKEVGAGTGLGLATVYGLVERLRGGVAVTSRPGSGAELTVYLPAAEAGVEGAPAATATLAVPGGTEVLLLAEDDHPVRTLTARILRSVGYTVLAARDGEEALELFRAHHDEIALVIADVIMPRRDGRALEAVVHELRPEIPVLFSTGYGGHLVLDGCPESAAGLVIAKPYDAAALLRRVRALLDAPGRGAAPA